MSSNRLNVVSVGVGIAWSTMAAHGQAPIPKLSGPCDPKAKSIVRDLLKRLNAGAGKTMVSGQTDLGDAKWMETETGRAPAILALDFMGTPKRMGQPSNNVETAIAWHKRGGIVAFQWHWVAPTSADKGKGFYVKESNIDLAAVLADPKSTAYAELLRDVDDVAADLAKLDRAGVPVLFRPLHEAQGRWFWWGAKGAEPCVKLYRLMFDRMTKRHGLHNLAWVWNVYPASQNKGKPEDWYPGDAFVDVVATDYLQGRSDYEALFELTHGTKVIGVAETMNPPDPAKSIADGAPWAYWVTWARRDWNKRSADDVRRVMKDPLTVTLDAKGR